MIRAVGGYVPHAFRKRFPVQREWDDKARYQKEVLACRCIEHVLVAGYLESILQVMNVKCMRICTSKQSRIFRSLDLIN